MSGVRLLRRRAKSVKDVSSGHNSVLGEKRGGSILVFLSCRPNQASNEAAMLYLPWRKRPAARLSNQTTAVIIRSMVRQTNTLLALDGKVTPP